MRLENLLYIAKSTTSPLKTGVYDIKGFLDLQFFSDYLEISAILMQVQRGCVNSTENLSVLVEALS
jgi:hypothetical protein